MDSKKIVQFVKEFDLLKNKRNAKKLGQNFILNFDVTRKIVGLAGDIENKNVLEIGPGPGGLSQVILEKKPQKLILIEKDKQCVNLLQSVFKDQQNVQIIQGDILDIGISEYGPLKVVANLPYNISTAVLIKLIRAYRSIEDMTLMFQKEVAARITAKPRTKAYGRLSVITQNFFEAKIVYVLPPSVFIPAPKVYSAVVYFKPKVKRRDCDIEMLEKITHILFSQRRKTLRKIVQTHQLKVPAYIDLQKRPEELYPIDFLEFYT